MSALDICPASAACSLPVSCTSASSVTHRVATLWISTQCRRRRKRRKLGRIPRAATRAKTPKHLTCTQMTTHLPPSMGPGSEITKLQRRQSLSSPNGPSCINPKRSIRCTIAHPIIRTRMPRSKQRWAFSEWLDEIYPKAKDNLRAKGFKPVLAKEIVQKHLPAITRELEKSE